MAERNTTGLYDPSFEHDSCGIGFVANIKGRKSHDIVSDALSMLARMEHRGACGCESNTGDGAGIIIQVPHEFFVDECVKIGIKLPAFGDYGVGVVFFPQDEKLREDCKEILNRNIEKLGMSLLGYRKLPTDNSMIGPSAVAVEPYMEQVFIKKPDAIENPDEFERKLFILRNYTSRLVHESLRLQVPNIKDSFHIASLSYKTIIYKGQLTTRQVRQFFPDLQRKEVVSALALVHSRFSTNTFPSFRLAQPFRYIAHNGEINTVKGNVNWMKAQEASFTSKYFTREELDMVTPICDLSNSDSANLDNVVELLTLSGRSLPHVMMMLIPEAWDGNEHMPEYKRDFYEYHAALMEPWDGPASICFTDGKMVGATLDRNGLRPSRYCVTVDDKVVMASEAGVVEIDPAKIVSKGRLQPGRMFIVNMEEGRIISDEEVKEKICTSQPYGEWLKNKIKITELPDPQVAYTQPDEKTLLKKQLSFGYSVEDVRKVLNEMAEHGKEPLGSMGTDAPLAVLSDQAQHLSSYFKQLFAQVTNPPIDPIRERLVMSLVSYVGGSLNLLDESPMHCRQVELNQPVLTNKDLEKLRHLDQDYFQTKTINMFFKADGTPGALEKALTRICNYAADAVEDGFSIILLSDRSIDSSHAPIPSLLATSAVHHHLMRKGLRGKVGIVVEAGDVWEVHHFATLISFGASAVNPYLAFETIIDQKRKGFIKSDVPDEKLFKNFIKAINDGLLKVFSKMGISTLQSYQGAQIFEALGIKKDVIDKYFARTVSRIGGLSLDGIGREALIKHKNAYPEKPVPNQKLEVGGYYQWKRRGEFHLFNPQTIHLLQQSTRTNDYQIYKKYSKLVNDQSERAATLRGLLAFNHKAEPVPLEEVEPMESIFKRFATGAMSFGSISFEAHTTLAIAMNRIGGKSNSGEGGEDEIRFDKKPNGDWERSAIKQVASGRFGVTSYYLANADELQIKMAQGAKPGEGGQLPGDKVDDWIGRVRHSTPGVGLISPPPHHDIYSIEDLAQLIYDLKNSNPAARINVKLVSEAGVGTIAAGVTKAHADVVLISGYDGGTGASPISSIRHAGLPWELGLAETHQTLVKNKLRSRITVQADGQMKTGRDLAIAALLGAEEWGVATAALVTSGCIMMRKCHLNTCPVGVATQNKDLRAIFSGKPEHVVNLFTFLATELREIMAELGFRTINEMVGQVDRLKVREDLKFWKHKDIDLSAVLHKEEAAAGVDIYKTEEQDHGMDHILDLTLIEKAKEALENQKQVSGEFSINNEDRSTGTMLSYEVSKKYKGEGLPDGTINFKFIGSAGQSFGGFAAKGLKFELEGETNDYFGKGLSGGKLIVYPDAKATFAPSENIICGNVAFYGATSGEAYIRGQAGERFCVRNSGAKAVVEGIGDHGCEYMTGGVAVILGETGRNFAAGMSGGVAYVLDENDTFKSKVNMGMIEFDPLENEDVELLKALIKNHLDYTNSDVADRILKNWDSVSQKFVKVMPSDYKAVLLKRKQQIQGTTDNKEVLIHG